MWLRWASRAEAGGGCVMQLPPSFSGRCCCWLLAAAAALAPLWTVRRTKMRRHLPLQDSKNSSPQTAIEALRNPRSPANAMLRRSQLLEVLLHLAHSGSQCVRMLQQAFYFRGAVPHSQSARIPSDWLPRPWYLHCSNSRCGYDPCS